MLFQFVMNNYLLLKMLLVFFNFCSSSSVYSESGLLICSSIGMTSNKSSVYSFSGSSLSKTVSTSLAPLGNGLTIGLSGSELGKTKLQNNLEKIL